MQYSIEKSIQPNSYIIEGTTITSCSHGPPSNNHPFISNEYALAKAVQSLYKSTILQL